LLLQLIFIAFIDLQDERTAVSADTPGGPCAQQALSERKNFSDRYAASSSTTCRGIAAVQSLAHALLS
jgi:hypothetical protein